MKAKLLFTLLFAGSTLIAAAQKSDLKEYVANVPEGRNILIQPHFENKEHVMGKIKINFVVDKNGKVISANSDEHETTANNKAFVHQCEQAVMAAKFSKAKKGMDTQNGSVSFAY